MSAGVMAGALMDLPLSWHCGKHITVAVADCIDGS